jgi:hypothetical protein
MHDCIDPTIMDVEIYCLAALLILGMGVLSAIVSVIFGSMSPKRKEPDALSEKAKTKEDD